MSRVFTTIFVCLAIVVATIGFTLKNSARSRRADARRVPVSRVLADTFMGALCRLPSDSETLTWESQPFDPRSLADTLSASDEGQRVRAVRSVYVDLLRRQPTSADCTRVRQWVDEEANIDDVRRDMEAQPEARRVAQVRAVFVAALGRDPLRWDEPALRRWVDSPFTIAEIRSRLASGRPLVGVHYFMWYRTIDGVWGNGLTSVGADAPHPAIGSYDSSDTDAIATHIRQIEDAGFDFVLVHVVFNGPRTWTNAHIFMDRLSGHRLKAAIVLDGLYTETPQTKAMWVRKVQEEYVSNTHYLQLYGQPLVVVFSSHLDFDVPGVTLRNLYWSPQYEPGNNPFNANGSLEPRDWAFWAPTPQPLVNGMVPVIPGYTDAALGRPRTMVYPRDDGRYYEEQWRRALMRHPELIVVYGWNEYFEQTAIEPTTTWGDRYLRLSACYIAHAHRGTMGGC